MRIGINALHYQAGKMGGVETYFRNLLDHIQEIDSANTYSVLCNRRYSRAIPWGNKAFEIIWYNYGSPSPRYFARGALKNFFDYDPLSSKIDRLSLDLVHHPFSVLDPMKLSTPSVLTFWDMQHEFFPDFFTWWQLYIRRKTYKRSAELARRIIVSSLFTKTCLMEHFGIDEAKIDVIYTGYGHGFTRIADHSVLDRVRRKYSLDFPFLFYPAATWPHKNHRNLLLAFKMLLETQKFDGKLVLTGMPVPGTTDLSGEIRRLGLLEHVRSLGYVPSEELPALYNLARLMAFPSLFEGFGIPVVEAMACGCPVSCSNATSLPEIVQDSGVLFDPASPADMADKIWSVWKDASLRECIRNKGLERAKEFDWATTVRKTVATYQMAR